MSQHNLSTIEVLNQSMIRQNKQGNKLVKCISALDIFSFIPVPKSRSVSTRCSLIGTILFFSIFFAYVTYDLVIFVNRNPPIPNSYYEKLDNLNYTAPNFSMVFMKNISLDVPVDPTGIFNYSIKQNIKKQKQSDDKPSLFVPCDPNKAKQWMGNTTFNNYHQQLLCPKEDVQLFLGGLLYVTQYAYSPAIKIAQCYYYNGSDWCTKREDIQKIQSQGRLFLFIEVPKGSEYEDIQRQYGSYRLYNFFLVQEVYNRINIQFQVNREIILPDYLTRWSQKQNTWLQIISISEMNSNVAVLNPQDGSEQRSLLLSIQFTLNPMTKVTKIAYSTLIDHIAQWGALWGVEFALFAIFFLSYNSRKYYKKNPKWERYDEQDQANNVINTDQ